MGILTVAGAAVTLLSALGSIGYLYYKNSPGRRAKARKALRAKIWKAIREGNNEEVTRLHNKLLKLQEGKPL